MTTKRITTTKTMPLDGNLVRQEFPALSRPVIFFDNPGGTQICRQSLARMFNYLVKTNANHGGSFDTSRASDAVVDQARAAMVDFINAGQPEEIIFGPNMTTLTFQISRSLAKTFQSGDSLVVTRLDHDANIAPWLRLAADRGVEILWVDFDPETGMLDLESYQRALEQQPKLVAVGYASNALGTINPILKIIRLAHQAGARVYVDAVQYAPHGPIDVQELGVDFLAFSTYKMFGPHAGVLYGRYDLLNELDAYRVRPAPALPPGKFETGTPSFEAIAGALGAIEYLQWLGESFGGEWLERYAGEFSGLRLALKQAMATIRSDEMTLSRVILDTLAEIPGVRIFGPSSTDTIERRVPTFAFRMDGYAPQEVAARLGEAGIYVWDGNFYAQAVTERLGLEDGGGLVRVGAVHYNTVEEIERLGERLREFSAV